MNWVVANLDDVCLFENGDRGRNYPSKTDFISKGMPFINAGNLKDNAIDKDSLNYISREKFDQLSNGKIKLGDFLFCLRGSLGKFAVIEDLDEGAIASSLVIIRNKSELNNRYLYHYLNGSVCARQINKFENGAAQPNLSARDLKKFEIPLPPLKEQERIASILDKAGTIFHKRQQSIQLANDFLRAVFLDMFGDPIINSNNWKTVSIGDITTDWRGGAPLKPEDFRDEGFPVLHKGAIQKNGKISTDSNKKTRTTEEYAKTHPNSVIDRSYTAVTLRDLVPTGPSIGLVADLSMAPEPEYILAQGAYGFKVNRSLAMPSYLVYLSNSTSFRQWIKKYTVGSTQIHIRNPIYKEIDIPLPDLNLQKDFDTIVQNIYNQKISQSRLIKESTNLFESLSQKAFRGEK